MVIIIAVYMVKTPETYSIAQEAEKINALLLNPMNQSCHIRKNIRKKFHKIMYIFTLNVSILMLSKYVMSFFFFKVFVAHELFHQC